MIVNTTTDYFTLRASLARTGSEGTQERPIPANVRIYDVAGASHALVQAAECNLPVGVLDWHPVMRATLLDLDHWVASNTEPPPSHLMPLEERPNDPMILPAPIYLAKAKIQVPVRDQDGNAVGGVRLPDISAPLDTYGGQNSPSTFLCSLVASYVPFAKTREERDAAKDSRPSLADRYKDRNDYVNHIRITARELTSAGLLLHQDAAIIVNAAAEVRSFK